MSLPHVTRYIGGAGWEDKLNREGVGKEKVGCQHLKTQESWRKQEQGSYSFELFKFNDFFHDLSKFFKT